MKLRNQSCQLILGHYRARPSPNFVRENSPYGKKKSHLWGKKFPLGEQKFQPKGIFSNTLRRGSNKGGAASKAKGCRCFLPFFEAESTKKARL